MAYKEPADESADDFGQRHNDDLLESFDPPRRVDSFDHHDDFDHPAGFDNLSAEVRGPFGEALTRDEFLTREKADTHVWRIIRPPAGSGLPERFRIAEPVLPLPGTKEAEELWEEMWTRGMNSDAALSAIGGVSPQLTERVLRALLEKTPGNKPGFWVSWVLDENTQALTRAEAEAQVPYLAALLGMDVVDLRHAFKAADDGNEDWKIRGKIRGFLESKATEERKALVFYLFILTHFRGFRNPKGWMRGLNGVAALEAASRVAGHLANSVARVLRAHTAYTG